MTLVIDQPLVNDTAQVHALVIGVGRYTHMASPAAAAFGLDADLTSPPISAVAFARFVADELNCPGTPVGSLDLYLSGGDEFGSEKSGTVRGIAEATTETVLKAVSAWKDRAGSQKDNVALFFFCGHGIQKAAQAGLLLSDFGALSNPLENALDLTATQGAMGTLAAPKLQCFFVDACRQPSLEAMRRAANVGRDPLGWVTDVRNAQDSSIFYATLPTDPAYGLTNEVSPFTRAVLRGLSGLGAYKRGPKKWVVTTSRLSIGIAAAMKWAQHHEGAPKQRSTPAGWQSDLPLNIVENPGPIPVSIDFAPPHQRVRHAAIHDSQNNELWRWESKVPWRLQVPTGDFVGRARYADKHWILDDQEVRPLPPEADLSWEATWRQD